jgi:hypothetical protein
MITLAERRVAERSCCEGPVEIFFSNPEPTVVTGSLVDSSATGFRVRHDCRTLDPGVEISYCRRGEMGHARVMWTMIEGPHRVSGVMIL